MTLFEWLSTLVSMAQCGLIYYGLRRMELTGARRDKQVDQQGKALEEMGKGLEEMGRSLGKIGAGIEVLLERSPKAA